MRQIFTSPRLDNVETVVGLLKDAGIDTHLTNARSWNRATNRDFSYTERNSGYQWPAVFVVKVEDFARARQLLRDAGVALPTTRSIAGPSYVPAPSAATPERPASPANRLRYGLVAGVVVAAVIYALRASGIF
jgi:hypothetical protein